QGCASLACDHRRGEVPGRDGCRDTDRCSTDDELAVRQMRRNGLAVHPLGLFPEPLQEGCGVVDLATGLRERFALFKGHEEGEFLTVLDHEIGPMAQNSCTLLGQELAPCGPGSFCRCNRAKGFSSSHIRNTADEPPIGRIGHLNPSTLVRIDPAAIKPGFFSEQIYAPVPALRTDFCFSDLRCHHLEPSTKPAEKE